MTPTAEKALADFEAEWGRKSTPSIAPSLADARGKESSVSFAFHSKCAKSILHDKCDEKPEPRHPKKPPKRAVAFPPTDDAANKTDLSSQSRKF